jgi:hypothetical protein
MMLNKTKVCLKRIIDLLDWKTQKSLPHKTLNRKIKGPEL